MVIVAIGLVVLVGSAAMVTDIARLYFDYLELQSACDSAVLAGATYLPWQTADASSATHNYAVNNGIEASEITSIQIAPSGKTITMGVSRQVSTTFARVLGINQFTLTTSSQAGVQPASSNVTGAIPIGLDYGTAYQYGQAVDMHSGDVGPGNWGGLALGGTGAQVYENNLANGYQGTLSIGQWLETEPGAKVGPTIKGVATRIADGLSADPTGTYAEHTLTDPRSAIVPLINWNNVNGRGEVELMGFASVWITGTDGTDILGIFIGQAANGGGDPTAPDKGVYHVALLK